MRKKHGSKDRDIISSAPAMLRAARAARVLALKTGTPFYVMQKGTIVNLNSGSGQRSLSSTVGSRNSKLSKRRIPPPG